MKRWWLVILALILVFSATPAFSARSGGTLNFMAPYGGDLYGLDPHKSTRYQDWLVFMNIHRSLYRWDAKTSTPQPDLAESVEVSEDGLVYTYKIRDNIKFHNGRPLTVDDIIWSYHRISGMEPASPSADNIRPIKGAKDVEERLTETIAGLKKIDDYTLEITLEDPVAIEYHLWLPGTAILPKEEVEARGDGFATDPVGCGAFKFVKWVKGSEVVLEKFPEFFMEGLPYLDKVVYKIMGEAASRDLAFKARELDATIVGAVNYPEYKADPVISNNMIEVAEMFTRMGGFNPEFKPFADKRVRQAINYAIPTDLIIEKVLKGKAFPARGYLPMTSPAYNPDIKKYDYDLEKAKALMKEAGYEKGFEVPRAIGTANASWGVGIFEAALSYLKKINVTLNIQQMEGAAMAERVRQGDYDMFIWSLDSGPDPLVALERWKGDNPQAAGNYVKYHNPEFDKNLTRASAERDQEKKIALIQEAEKIFVEDAPIWFFNYNKAIMAHHPWVHGLAKVAPEMMFQDLTAVWVDENSPRADEK